MADPESITTVAADELGDRAEDWPVVHREVRHAGHVTTYVTDTVQAPDGSTLTRDWIEHPGAVGVIALDSDERVVLVQQYRHPAGFRLFEPPAGLLDVAEEEWLIGAQRELAEEAMLAADRWDVLVDMFTSPGASGENVRIYLARDLRPVARPDGFELEGEEADMSIVRARLDDLLDGVFAGRLQNPLLVTGCLAAAQALRTGRELRPADSPWPARAPRPRTR
ncbi:NUDIX domain-containing protein [Naumannella halotolerans]|uniref:ADP-ribose pyrophosphatase n=1 Tax=Naumannella halotolerans TaxID=993414 RepID=A0A4R7J6T8_9ACTN|nr:NUDIX hydrolase [Naumannella halotolerans]TDT33110.1 ADP-ribose pyrophosphatase [Naumannella halotolerans]